MKQTTLDLIKNINENTFIPATTQNELFELFQLDTVADLRKVSRNFMKVYELLEHFDNQTSNATKEKEGIVKFGTETGTALEGNRLAEIIGLEFGGNIQDTGNKVKGKFYYDNVTNFYYECIADTSLTYNESSKFRAISNKPISDKLENLFDSGQNFAIIGNILIQWGHITSQQDKYRLVYPKKYKTTPSLTIASWGTDLRQNTHIDNITNTKCDFFTITGMGFGLSWMTVGLI